MKERDFCFWLKGIFEIQQAGLDNNEKRSFKLSEAQIEMIAQHLNYVFDELYNSNIETIKIKESDFDFLKSSTTETKIC